MAMGESAEVEARRERREKEWHSRRRAETEAGERRWAETRRWAEAAAEQWPGVEATGVQAVVAALRAAGWELIADDPGGDIGEPYRSLGFRPPEMDGAEFAVGVLFEMYSPAAMARDMAALAERDAAAPTF